MSRTKKEAEPGTRLPQPRAVYEVKWTNKPVQYLEASGETALVKLLQSQLNLEERQARACIILLTDKRASVTVRGSFTLTRVGQILYVPDKPEEKDGGNRKPVNGPGPQVGVSNTDAQTKEQAPAVPNAQGGTDPAEPEEAGPGVGIANTDAQTEEQVPPVPNTQDGADPAEGNSSPVPATKQPEEPDEAPVGQAAGSERAQTVPSEPVKQEGTGTSPHPDGSVSPSEGLNEPRRSNRYDPNPAPGSPGWSSKPGNHPPQLNRRREREAQADHVKNGEPSGS